MAFFTDSYGYRSLKYADGAEFYPDAEFMRLGETHGERNDATDPRPISGLM